MRLKYSPQAADDIRAAGRWWRENRADAPRLFRQELDAARRLLASSPWIGVAAREAARADVRRVFLGKCRQILYYEVDEERREVIVLRMWHMSRGEPPEL